MANVGITINQDKVTRLISEMDNILEPNYQALMKQDFVEKNKKGTYKRNMKTLKQYLEKNVTTPLYTTKGNISTNTESLTAYLNAHPQ